jgi:hypothetical protein
MKVCIKYAASLSIWNIGNISRQTIGITVFVPYSQD